MTRRVSIFGCGVQKGGTTSLHGFLSEHPALSPPDRKELHFFDDETVDWNAPDYTSLHSFFPSDDGDEQRFEITPIYSFWPPSIERIYRYNPSARLIYLFRDPFERAWSQWRMETSRGWEMLPFSQAIREGRARMDDSRPLSSNHRICSYVERGLYGAQVRRALQFFPRERLLFLRSQDLQSRHLDTLNRISSFLAIEPFPDTPPRNDHLGPLDPDANKPTKADRQLVADLVQDDLWDFSRLTGLEISDWPTTTATSTRRTA